jgi:hypothetical protein
MSIRMDCRAVRGRDVGLVARDATGADARNAATGAVTINRSIATLATALRLACA